MEHKAQIRKKMQIRRREATADERAAACGYICDKLGSIPLAESDIIAGYYPTQDEIDILQLLDHYHGRNNQVCMPTVTKPELILKFLEWTPGAVMKTGPYNIPEPVGGKLLVPSVILVPLLAFDRERYRLGYGGGYYDATIARLKESNPSLRTIGIGYSFQEVERLPREAHDARLDMVVTEKEVIA